MNKPLVIPMVNLKKKIDWYLENSPEEGNKYLVIDTTGSMRMITVPDEVVGNA